jgi:hypothetical protein
MTIDIFAKAQERIDSEAEAARRVLKDSQVAMIKCMEGGYALQTSSVESIFLQEHLVRAWNQVQALSLTSTDKEELKARLSTWVEDATEQVMAPGRSQSTSFVRTEQMAQETEALKSTARSVSYIVRMLASA